MLCTEAVDNRTNFMYFFCTLSAGYDFKGKEFSIKINTKMAHSTDFPWEREKTQVTLYILH